MLTPRDKDDIKEAVAAGISAAVSNHRCRFDDATAAVVHEIGRDLTQEKVKVLEQLMKVINDDNIGVVRSLIVIADNAYQTLCKWIARAILVAALAGLALFYIYILRKGQ